jgi:hypothetical protein
VGAQTILRVVRIRSWHLFYFRGKIRYSCRVGVRSHQRYKLLKIAANLIVLKRLFPNYLQNLCCYPLLFGQQ